MSTLSTLRSRKKAARVPETSEKSASVETGYPVSTENRVSSQAGTTRPPDATGCEPPAFIYSPTSHVLSAASSGKLPAAAPCPACGCPLFWLDPRSTIHCAACQPPASQSMQRGDLHVVVVGGSPAWLHDHPELTTPSKSGEDQDQPSASGSHRPPDVFEVARGELRPTMEQIDSGECFDDSPPCECKKGYKEKNFFGDEKKFCCVDRRRAINTRGGTVRESSAGQLHVLSRVLRLRAELSPSTAEWRRKRAEKLAKQAADDAVRDAVVASKVIEGHEE